MAHEEERYLGTSKQFHQVGELAFWKNDGKSGTGDEQDVDFIVQAVGHHQRILLVGE